MLIVKKLEFKGHEVEKEKVCMPEAGREGEGLRQQARGSELDWLI